ncbi:MAG: DUF2231 domain-containing protein [FCB group bacterium]|nr:DUF2231 domain-containing protein [FCB group bacterium]
MHILHIWKPRLWNRFGNIWLLGLAAISGFLAGQTGGKTAATVQSDLTPTVLDLLERHEAYATITIWGAIILFIAWLYLALKGTKENLTNILVLIGLSMLALLVAYTGHLGGKLVYLHQVGVQNIP